MQFSQKDDSIARANYSDKRRFWSKVKKGGDCWVWTGSTLRGYGCFWVQGSTVRAHRAAKIWATKNEIMAELCCHRCNNTSCVRPSHIYWGTNAENSHDMALLGLHVARIRRGSGSPQAKLNEQQAQTIAASYFAGGISTYELARRHGVTRGAIDNIVRGKTWKHVVSRPEKAMKRHEMGHKRGEACSHAKLDAQAVRQIREMRRQGAMAHDIAKKFGIAQTNVSAICNRTTWRHID